MRIREEGERGSRRRIRMGDGDGWRVEAHRSRVKGPRWALDRHAGPDREEGRQSGLRGWTAGALPASHSPAGLHWASSGL